MVPVQESKFPSCGNAEIPGVDDIWWGIHQCVVHVSRYGQKEVGRTDHQLHQLGL